MKADDLLLVEEVAREMRAPVATVWCWIRAGKLRASRPGRRLLIRRSDLDAFLAASPANEAARQRAPKLRLVPTDVDPEPGERFARNRPSEPPA
jgi:excisionase family DNA binding protein